MAGCTEWKKRVSRWRLWRACLQWIILPAYWSELWCLAVRLIRNSLSTALYYLVVIILIILEVLMLLLIVFLIILIEVLVILEVVLVDRFSVAVLFGASFPAHVSGAYLSTDSGECQACGPLRTTIDIGSVSHEECLLQWAWIVVVPIVAILVTAIFFDGTASHSATHPSSSFSSTLSNPT